MFLGVVCVDDVVGVVDVVNVSSECMLLMVHYVLTCTTKNDHVFFADGEVMFDYSG